MLISYELNIYSGFRFYSFKWCTFQLVWWCIFQLVYTVEIRCEMKKEGNYANALYTIRYFQFEGEGTLKMDNGITFLPNDRYLLENEKFRLYYTSGCSEAQNFIVVVEDNFGNAYELEFDFNNQNVKDETLSVVPIGNFKPLS